MNGLRIAVVLLEQRKKYLYLRMELIRYRGEDPSRLDARVFELDRVLAILKSISEE